MALNQHNQKAYNLARQVLESRLNHMRLRKTVERYRILEEIYARDDHFDVDTFMESLHNKNFSVSRATIYNVLDLFVELGLVIRHQFADGLAARYEKAIGRKQHSHVVCSICGNIEEFCDPRLQAIQNNVAETFRSEIQTHSLTFYGVCRACGEKANAVE
ncbi:transcriptional repressor [Marinilongibacter aquaticus]|uniref:Fur family transcriptional regulator n=1 Tax=Marinilongibacter aquaticus TaxID=2975157 RepID=UPI0021BD714D|nr:transcriptional repressor [Marinilongibacter aquaticus]UBM60427.1 transcriptional repressor [Marinilongibacter aquaticus]